jgi:hypothetical protein
MFAVAEADALEGAFLADQGVLFSAVQVRDEAALRSDEGVAMKKIQLEIKLHGIVSTELDDATATKMMAAIEQPGYEFDPGEWGLNWDDVLNGLTVELEDATEVG